MEFSSPVCYDLCHCKVQAVKRTVNGAMNWSDITICYIGPTAPKGPPVIIDVTYKDGMSVPVIFQLPEKSFYFCDEISNFNRITANISDHQGSYQYITDQYDVLNLTARTFSVILQANYSAFSTPFMFYLSVENSVGASPFSSKMFAIRAINTSTTTSLLLILTTSTPMITSTPTNTSTPMITSTPMVTSTPTITPIPSDPVNDFSGSILVISIVISTTLIVIIAISIVCGTILLRHWNRESKKSFKKLSPLLNIDNDYYSVVGIDEPSICEDVEGINLQDDTADDNKEGHKTVTDHILMLGSIVSPKKYRYQRSSQGKSNEISSVKKSSVHVKDSPADTDCSDLLIKNIRSTSATGEYTELSTSGKFVSSSEQILSQSPSNGTHIPTSQQSLQPTLGRGEYLDHLSMGEQVLSLQRNSSNGAQNLDVGNSRDTAQRNPVKVMNTLMLHKQQELPLEVNKNSYVEETEV
ncbi:uncharacterized protein [Dysidea avara]